MGEWCHQDVGEPISNLGLKSAELSLLAILRHYCASFAVPERQSWIAAISVALSNFGQDRGAEVAVAALGVIQSIRRLRHSCFIFNTPECVQCSAFVTGHERLVISALRAAARGQREAAHAYATLLCEGNDGEPVVFALEVLVERAFGAAKNSCVQTPVGLSEQVPSASS